MIQFADSAATITVMVRMLAVGTLLSCAEYLSQPSLLKDDGLMSWEIGRLRQPWLARGWLGATLNFVLSYPNVIWLLVIRISVATLMLLGPADLITKSWLILIAAVLCWFFVTRSSYGQDGADQLAYIIYLALAVSSLSGVTFVRSAFLWFVALQSCLAYCVAGVAKARSKGWRDGDYLIDICYTHIYGHAGFADFLSCRRRLAKILARTLIVCESSFPLVLLMPAPIAVGVLAMGAIFHMANAYFMGLNTFFWSFLTTYPAILYCVKTRGW